MIVVAPFFSGQISILSIKLFLDVDLLFLATSTMKIDLIDPKIRLAENIENTSKAD